MAERDEGGGMNAGVWAVNGCVLGMMVGVAFFIAVISGVRDEQCRVKCAKRAGTLSEANSVCVCRDGSAWTHGYAIRVGTEAKETP